MLVQSTQSRKSWKSRSRLVEIDTVDFLFRRAHLYVHLYWKVQVSDLYRCAEFSTCALSKSHQSVRPNSAAVRHKYRDLYYLHTRFTLSWGQRSLSILSLLQLFCIPFSFYHLFTYVLPLENCGKLRSRFYRRERQRSLNVTSYPYYSTYCKSFRILPSLEFRRGRRRSR